MLGISFILLGHRIKIELSEIESLVNKFTEADSAIRTVFPKADPFLVVNLIFDEKEKRNRIYTLETTIKPGQNVEEIRDTVLQVTGMIPSFYLEGTKLIVSHPSEPDLVEAY